MGWEKFKDLRELIFPWRRRNSAYRLQLELVAQSSSLLFLTAGLVVFGHTYMATTIMWSCKPIPYNTSCNMYLLLVLFLWFNLTDTTNKVKYSHCHRFTLRYCKHTNKSQPPKFFLPFFRLLLKILQRIYHEQDLRVNITGDA